MKVIITSKNFTPSENFKNKAEVKMSKLDKFFSKETVANVRISGEPNNKIKLESTINAGGLIFRAEDTNTDVYYCLDNVLDKLSSQMSRFKKKLVRKHRDQKEVMLAELPDTEDAVEEVSVVKTKTFKLNPMTTDEAVLQMELLGHSFFIFRDAESDSVNVVYKRDDGSYGLLVTE
ncbi:MAG: ribosome-associated translation inhibitor RaiA [Firmicutes bacterium]|nr:ribosome-associated translation inhibitor RaiA [Bacillota bacterium]